MARVRRYSSQEQVPVQQANLINAGNFRPDTSSAEALGIAGETAFVIGKKLKEEKDIKKELARRKRDSQDRIGITDVNAIMDDAEREYAKQIIGKPLTEHAAIRTKIDADARARANQIDLSPEAKEIAKANTDIKMEKFADEAELANIIATNNDALIRTSEAYETALVESDIDTITEAEGLLDAELKNMEPAEAAKYKADLEERAVKEMEKKALTSAMDRASLEPAIEIAKVGLELEKRKAGKESEGEFALVSDTGLRSIKKYAETLMEKAGEDSKIAMNNALVDAYSQIRDGATNIDAMMDAIDADPTISAEDKLSAAEKIPTYFNKINSTKSAEESSELIYDRLTRSSESVERGDMSPADFEEQYANLKQYLTRTDQRDIRSKDVVATKTMQNRAFTDATAAATPTLVERTETEMGAMIIARNNAETLKELDKVNFFNIAIKKNQAERWNMGQFRKELRSLMSQNPEWSQSQIFVAQEVLLDQHDKPVGELLKAFDGANPKRAITKTAPHKEFEDIWPDLSDEERAIIWAERMAGTPISVILGTLEE